LKITKNGIKEMKFVPCIQSGFTTTYIQEQEEQKQLYSYLQGLSNEVQIDDEGVILDVKKEEQLCD
jgi:poly-gamma-glutamate synthesis protein (capsule biosynthesis protein)